MDSNINIMRKNPNTDWDFISFSFNGRDIQDFGLIAVADNNRYSRQLVQSFTANYSTIKGRAGDIYWDTDIGPQTISFSLATDGMTSEQFRDFQAFFTPGVNGKLVLAESPYRYVYARLNEAPVLSFLAFEDVVNVRGINFYTTIYKGNTSLSFHISEPKWISDDIVASNEELEKKWYLESALPNVNLISTSSYIHIAGLKKINNVDIIDDTPFNISPLSLSPYYNAGTKEANPIIAFAINLSIDPSTKKITTFYNDELYLKKFSDISSTEFEKYVIKPPLVIRDYNSAIDLMYNYRNADLSNENNRNELKAVIYTNIDHPDIISTLATLLNNEQTYSAILTKFSNTFSTSDLFNFYIDTENFDIKVSFNDYIYYVENNTVLLGAANSREEDAAEIVGSKMLTISANKGYLEHFYLQPSCFISTSKQLINFSMNFKYSYV